jgi:hypothetical protein
MQINSSYTNTLVLILAIVISSCRYNQKKYPFQTVLYKSFEITSKKFDKTILITSLKQDSSISCATDGKAFLLTLKDLSIEKHHNGLRLISEKISNEFITKDTLLISRYNLNAVYLNEILARLIETDKVLFFDSKRNYYYNKISVYHTSLPKIESIGRYLVRHQLNDSSKMIIHICRTKRVRK